MACMAITVAILAQGTSWAVAVTQAFLVMGSIPSASGQHVHTMVGSAGKAAQAAYCQKTRLAPEMFK